jgi:hypothetical protein
MEVPGILVVVGLHLVEQVVIETDVSKGAQVFQYVYKTLNYRNSSDLSHSAYRQKKIFLGNKHFSVQDCYICSIFGQFIAILMSLLFTNLLIFIVLCL